MSMYFPLLVWSVISLVGRCEEFVWNINNNHNISTPSQNNSRRWENPQNWLVSNSTATRPPCQKDYVYFPINYTYPVITISSQVKVLGMNWKGRNLTTIQKIKNLDQYFVLKDGGSLAIDPDCGGIQVCECQVQNSTRDIGMIVTTIIASAIIATGIVVVTSSMLLFVLIRKPILARRKKAGQVFTFQTLNELDIEDEHDRFDVTVVHGDDFPSGKSKIPEDLTGLLDEDSLNGDESGERTQKSRNIPEDEKALLADSSQDITTVELIENMREPGNQTDL